MAAWSSTATTTATGMAGPVGPPVNPVHALQRAVGNRAVAGLIGRSRMPAVQRDTPAGRLAEETGIRVEPGEVRSGVLGSTIPIPAGVTVLKPPGRGRGDWLTVPSFQLRLDPRGLVAGLLDTVSLGGLSLTNPTLTYNAGTDSVTAEGTVSIPTDYPGWDTPTNILVRIRSTSLGHFRLQGGTGPFVADLTLDISYDSAPLERALAAARAGDYGGAAAGLLAADRHARFAVSGSAGIGTRAHKLPLTYLRGSGSVDPSGARATGGAVGLIGLPKGTFHPDLAVPAVGGAYGAASVRRGGGAGAASVFGGVTGTPSIPDLLSGNLAGAFAPFAYAQVQAARRTADGHQFSILLSAQYQLGSDSAAQSPFDQFRGELATRRQAERTTGRVDGDPKTADIDPALRSEWAQRQRAGASGTGFNVTLTGTFDLFGGR